MAVTAVKFCNLFGNDTPSIKQKNLIPAPQNDIIFNYLRSKPSKQPTFQLKTGSIAGRSPTAAQEKRNCNPSSTISPAPGRPRPTKASPIKLLVKQG